MSKSRVMKDAIDLEDKSGQDWVEKKAKRRKPKAIHPSGVAQKSKKASKKKIVLNQPCTICVDDSQMCDFFLKCGHVFHWDCVNAQLSSKWSGIRVSLNYMKCAICRSPIHDNDAAKLKPHRNAYFELKEKLTQLANERAAEDSIDCKGLEGEERLEYLFNTLAFYMCNDCNSPYCGGLVSCNEELELDPQQLRCQSCTFKRLAPPPAPPAPAVADDGKAAPAAESVTEDGKPKPPDLRCLTHGYKYAVFKCDSCCSVATWDCCWNHYCERCHSEASKPKNYPCPGTDKCPLGVVHPPNLPAVHGGAAEAPVPFVLGCLKCIGIEDKDVYVAISGKNPYYF